MATCLDYGCADEIQAQLLNDCEQEVLGGASAAVVLPCGHTITDPSDGTAINALIASGDARLYENLKIGIDLPSAVEIESNIACRPPKRVTDERSGTWIDGNVNSNNVSAYDSLKNNTIGGLIISECDSGKVTFINEPLSFSGGRILPPTDSEFQRFEMVFKWKSRTEPTIHDAPVGVFS